MAGDFLARPEAYMTALLLDFWSSDLTTRLWLNLGHPRASIPIERVEIAVAVDRLGYERTPKERRCWGSSKRKSHETLRKYKGDVKTAHDGHERATTGSDVGEHSLPPPPNWWNKAGSAG